jgi:hypothetical protein
MFFFDSSFVFDFIKKYLTAKRSMARIECEGRGERRAKNALVLYFSSLTSSAVYARNMGKRYCRCVKNA